MSEEILSMMKRYDKLLIVFALIGFLLPLAVLALGRIVSGFEFEEWMVYIWPTSLMMMAIAGHSKPLILLGTIGLSALLNAAIYAIVGWLAVRCLMAFSKSSAAWLRK